MIFDLQLQRWQVDQVGSWTYNPGERKEVAVYFCFVDGGRLMAVEGPEDRFPQEPTTVFWGCPQCGRVLKLHQGRFWGNSLGMGVLVEGWVFDPKTRVAKKI